MSREEDQDETNGSDRGPSATSGERIAPTHTAEDPSQPPESEPKAVLRGKAREQLVATRPFPEGAMRAMELAGAVNDAESAHDRGFEGAHPAPSSPLLYHWDRYELLEFLGQGGMGTVYRARDLVLGREVAIKLLLRVDPESRQRLLYEARALARIDHPHICKIYEIGEVEGRDYIAMQLVVGVSLSDAFPQLSLEERVAVMRTVALAIHEAHRLGFVHRDIKPSNIMIERTVDGQPHPRVMDFGLARDLAGSQLTATNMVIGSPPYMAPEQAQSSRDIDPRTDVYGLGATLYELVAGQPPFSADASPLVVMHAVLTQDPAPPRSIVPTLPRDLETIILKCLNKAPEKRYESARALAEDLGRYLDHKSILGRRLSLLERSWLEVRRHRALATVLGLALLWSLGLGAYGLYSVIRARQQANLAATLAQDVKATEWVLRVVREMPPHDTSPERRLIRSRMESIQAQSDVLGAWSRGPVLYALGRGELLLNNVDQAFEHLQRAAQVGVDTPELHYALGLVYGARYERAAAQVRYRGDPTWRVRQRRELARTYLEPALGQLDRLDQLDRLGQLGQLEKGRALHLESPEFLAALVAFYREQYEAAETRAERVLTDTPWVYEARVLQGHARLARARAELDRGVYEPARRELAQALRYYRQAAEIGSNDATVYEAIADGLLEEAEIDRRQGRPSKALDAVIAACDQALVVESTRIACHVTRARALWQRVHDLPTVGHAPQEALDASVAAARRAVALDPRHALARDALGNAYLDRGVGAWAQGEDPRPSWKLALVEFAQAIAVQPDFPWAFNDLGVTHRQWGAYQQQHGEDPRPEYAAALVSYRRALAVDPQYLYACSNLVDLHAQLAEDTVHQGHDPRDEVAAAVREGERCQAIDRNFYAVPTNMVRAELAYAGYLIDAGQDPRPVFERTGVHLEQLRRLAPTDVRYSLFVALWRQLEARHQLGQGVDPRASLALGHQALAEATRLAPGCGDCEIVHARLYRVAADWAERTGQPEVPSLEAAWRAAERAVKFEPDNAEARQELARSAAALAASRQRTRERAPAPGSRR